VLHENIDGEALMWAAGRLDPARWKRRIICVVSDGAPVDDSTLLANDDQRLLMRHLDETEVRLAGEGLILGTLFIGGDQHREPAIFERAEEPQAAAAALIGLLRRTLLPSASEEQSVGEIAG
jgi:cobaltochelatase CobT